MSVREPLPREHTPESRKKAKEKTENKEKRERERREMKFNPSRVGSEREIVSCALSVIRETDRERETGTIVHCR